MLQIPALTRYFNSIQQWCIFAILLFLPVSYRLCSITIFVLLGFTLLKVINDRDPVIFYKQLPFWISSGVIWISIVGLLYTTDTGHGFSIIETAGSLILFPIIFNQTVITDEQFWNIKKWFILIITLVIAFLEARIFWLILTTEEKRIFSYYYTYENLTMGYVAQPVYFGIYVVIVNIFCLTMIFASSKWIRHNFLLGLLIAINCVFLFQLAARSTIILNFALITIYLAWILYTRKKWLIGAIAIGAVVVSSLALYNFSSFARLRMESVWTELTSDNLKEVDPLSRILIWPSAIQVIRENWAVGVGTGDAESALLDVYQQRGLNELYEAGLNGHNQYLTFLMRFGIFAGTLAIFLTILLPLYYAIKARNIEAVLFMLLMSGFFMTENALGRVQGVIFFAFFQTIFVILTFQQSRTWRDKTA